MLRNSHLDGTVTNGVREVTKLNELLTHEGVFKQNVAVVVDGNVMCRSAPPLSYKEFIRYTRDQVFGFYDVAKHVIVVFDEPDAMTLAKKEEQMARDAQRTKREIVVSEDVLKLPQTDAYNEADIENCPNIQSLMENRASRIRLMDMAFAHVIKEACKNRLQQMKMLGVAQTTLTLDGVDARGDSRPHGATRVAEVVSTEDAMVKVLHRDGAIGEGDIKLVDVEKAIEKHRWEEGSPVASVRVVLHHTIDTDSLMINLIAEAERKSRNVNDLISLLCLREPGRKRKGEDRFYPAHYVVVNMEKMLTTLLLVLFGGDNEAVRKLQREAVALTAMGIAACGCDFNKTCKIKSLRASEMLCAIATIIQNEPTVLPSMCGAWSGSTKKTRKTVKSLERVMHCYGLGLSNRVHAVPTYLLSEHYDGSVTKVRQKHALDVQSPELNPLLRAAWTVAYWHQHEFTELHNFGWPVHLISAVTMQDDEAAPSL